MTRDELDEMTRGYIECLLWSTNDESDPETYETLGGTPLDESFDYFDIMSHGPAETAERCWNDCAAFYDANAADLADIDASQAGHDFWLTRVGHGTGFWDRGNGALGDRLTDAARIVGECWPYIGDDGLLYIN